MNGVDKMFLEEGLNDFVPKPMELKVLVNAVRKWLPKEKMQMRRGEILDIKPQTVTKADLPQIGDLDVQTAFSRLGSEKLFWSVLKEYYRVIDKKCGLIRNFWEQHDFKSYTVEVHALKSVSRQIGAMQLADLAASLEAAGNEMNEALIDEQTDRLLETYCAYKEILAPWCAEKTKKEHGGESITLPELQEAFARMQEAADDLDMDELERIVEHLLQYRYEEQEQRLLERLQEAVADFDVEICETIIDEWKEQRKDQ